VFVFQSMFFKKKLDIEFTASKYKPSSNLMRNEKHLT
jgi:hypothetical protein